MENGTLTVSFGSNIPAGNYNFQVSVEGSGKAVFAEAGQTAVQVVGAVDTVSPAAGSTNGGTVVTVTGSGFVDGQTSVTVGGSNSPCSINTIAQVCSHNSFLFLKIDLP